MNRIFEKTAVALALALALASPAAAQMQGGPFQNGTPLAPGVVAIDPGAGMYFGTNRVGVTGHIESTQKGGAVPVATICGAQPDAGSSDSAGSITNVGTATCTLTFGVAFAVKPSCLVTDNTTNRATMVAIASTTALTITGITAADALSWVCVAKSGG